MGSREEKREGLFVILHYSDHRRPKGEENLSESGGSFQTRLMNVNESFSVRVYMCLWVEDHVKGKTTLHELLTASLTQSWLQINPLVFAY